MGGAMARALARHHQNHRNIRGRSSDKVSLVLMVPCRCNFALAVPRPSLHERRRPPTSGQIRRAADPCEVRTAAVQLHPSSLPQPISHWWMSKHPFAGPLDVSLVSMVPRGSISHARAIPISRLHVQAFRCRHLPLAVVETQEIRRSDLQRGGNMDQIERARRERGRVRLR